MAFAKLLNGAPSHTRRAPRSSHCLVFPGAPGRQRGTAWFRVGDDAIDPEKRRQTNAGSAASVRGGAIQKFCKSHFFSSSCGQKHTSGKISKVDDFPFPLRARAGAETYLSITPWGLWAFNTHIDSHVCRPSVCWSCRRGSQGEEQGHHPTSWYSLVFGTVCRRHGLCKTEVDELKPIRARRLTRWFGRRYFSPIHHLPTPTPTHTHTHTHPPHTLRQGARHGACCKGRP